MLKVFTTCLHNTATKLSLTSKKKRKKNAMIVTYPSKVKSISINFLEGGWVF